MASKNIAFSITGQTYGWERLVDHAEEAPLRAEYKPNGEYGNGAAEIVLYDDDDEVSFGFRPDRWIELQRLAGAAYAEYLEATTGKWTEKEKPQRGQG